MDHTILLSSHRRAFDVERGLDRTECKVTQYSIQEEDGIDPVIDVVARVAVFLPLSLSIFQDPVNISG